MLGVLSAVAISPALASQAQSTSQTSTNSAPSPSAQPSAQSDAADNRYGFLNLLDHRSVYGQSFFPEPFLVDDSDLEVNEARFDWFHTKAHSTTSDEATAEIEKGFGLLTVEGELHYERNVEDGNVSDGIGNIDLGARYPFYQYVSGSGLVDSTFGAGVEVGIPVHSSVSKNTEFVPKVFNDLKLGDHLSLQTIVGYSMLYGPGPDGGAQVFEYGIDLGYSFQHEQLPIPHVRQLVPMFEISGETGLNHGESGVNSVTGLTGFRVDTDPIGRFAPRLGFGFFFPLNGTAHNDTHWGTAISLVFEY
jgi:hypothetical protein